MSFIIFLIIFSYVNFLQNSNATKLIDKNVPPPIKNVISINRTKGLLYPRESESREVRELNGIWRFLPCDDLEPNQGIVEKWYQRKLDEVANNTQFIPVPSSYNDIFVEAQIRDHVGPVFYESHFFVPQRWKFNKRIWLRFGGVHYQTIVWLNGVELLRHEIGHLPFEVEITWELHYGAENRLTLSCDNRLTTSTLPQGQQYTYKTIILPKGITSRVIQRYSFDFFNYAGIQRSVLLYTTPLTFIYDVALNTTLQQQNNMMGLLEYRIEINSLISNVNLYPEEKQLYYLNLQLRDKNGQLVTKAISTKGDHFVGKMEVDAVHPWWPYLMNPEYGYLYTLEIYLHSSLENDLIDVYRMKIGFRTLSWNCNSLFINNEPVYLKGFGRHEDSDIRGKGIDLPLLLRDFNLIKWIGANAYRTTHYPYSEESMQLADENGIMIIDECPAVNIDVELAQNASDILLKNHLSSLEQLIHRDRNHPSVIMWSIANEPRSQQNASIPYFEKIRKFVKLLDTIRPITAAINSNPKDDKLAGLLDIISFNRYNAWYHDEGILETIIPNVILEARGWHRKYNVPVLMTEYGAGSIESLHSLPSSMWTEEYQVDLLAEHFEAFDLLRSEYKWFIGEMIWNFADFKTAQNYVRAGGNKKGIFTRNRQPKSSAFLLRRRYFQLCKEKSIYNCPQPDDLEPYIEMKNATWSIMAIIDKLNFIHHLNEGFFPFDL